MSRSKGFTLVEAAIAIGVVAILSGIIIPLVLKSLRDARVARARNDINVIVGAIAHQLKDTGTRPRAAVLGDGGANGAGNAMWFSEGALPLAGGAVAAGADAIPGARGAQTFSTLFSLAHDDARGNQLFGFPVFRAMDEFGYRGPYLSRDVTEKTDPWGNAYLVLGYNADGQESGGPIWVVSAGESRTITAVNLDRVAGAGGLPPTYHPTWDHAGLSAGNLVVRVH